MTAGDIVAGVEALGGRGQHEPRDEIKVGGGEVEVGAIGAILRGGDT